METPGRGTNQPAVSRFTYGYVVVFACFSILLIIYGIHYTFGIYFDIYGTYDTAFLVIGGVYLVGFTLAIVLAHRHSARYAAAGGCGKPVPR